MEENKRPKVSIITVVLNGEKTLERTIQSVLNQTYPQIEYLIIDGGSDDGSVAIIKKYQKKISYWVSEKDKGLYDAMNKGIRQASGEWVLILNSDDYYLNNKAIEEAVKCIKKRNKTDKNFYYFTIFHEFPNGWRKKYKRVINCWNKWRLYWSAYIPHLALWVNKKQYEEIGLYDLNFKIAADHDFILRLTKKYRPVFIDLPLAVMTIGGRSSRDEKKTFWEFRQVTIKNGLPALVADVIFWLKIGKLKLKNFLGKHLTKQKDF